MQDNFILTIKGLSQSINQSIKRADTKYFGVSISDEICPSWTQEEEEEWTDGREDEAMVKILAEEK